MGRHYAQRLTERGEQCEQRATLPLVHVEQGMRVRAFHSSVAPLSPMNAATARFVRFLAPRTPYNRAANE